MACPRWTCVRAHPPRLCARQRRVPPPVFRRRPHPWCRRAPRLRVASRALARVAVAGGVRAVRRSGPHDARGARRCLAAAALSCPISGGTVVLTRVVPRSYDVGLPCVALPSAASVVPGFPATRHSVVAGIASTDRQQRRVAFDALISAYWRPVYKYVRIKWGADRDDAADLTQEFFARAYEKNSLARFDPERARFRTFLRVCLDGFVANEHKAAGRLKRGGGLSFVPLDFATAESELADSPATLDANTASVPGADDDALFRQEWIRTLFADAVSALRESCAAAGKEKQFAVFQRYDLDDNATGRPTYAQLGDELGIPVTQVTNYLAFARRELRRLLLERLRALSATDEEFRLEARELLGIDPS